MASTITVKCNWCKKEFKARTADIKRGWGKYCSKSCKASDQECKTNGQYRKLQNSYNNFDQHGHIFAMGEDGHGQL